MDFRFFIAWFFVLLPTAATAQFVLPAPELEQVGAGPTGWSKVPGGVALPETRASVDSGSPAIGYCTDACRIDETAAIFGDKLADAEFVLWSEGLLCEVEPIRQATDRAQLAIPTRGASIVDALPRVLDNSTMLLWPRNFSGYGRPVRINGPKINWVWPGRVWANRPFQTVRLFGRSLAFADRKSLVVAKRGNDPPIKLQIKFQGEYEIEAMLPAGYQPGTYTVWAHNETGGRFGWSNAGTFLVEANPYNVSPIFAVDSQAGATDNAKIANAIAAANAAGGGTVSFSAREYTLNARVFATGAAQNPIRFQGAGRGRTVLKCWPEEFLWLTCAGSEVRDLSLDGLLISVRNKDMTIDNVEGKVIDYQGAISTYAEFYPGGLNPRINLNLLVTNSSFTGTSAAAVLGQSSFTTFQNCEFFGRYEDGEYAAVGDATPNYRGQNLGNHGISVYSCQNLLVERCRFASEDALNGKILTRGIGVIHNTDANHVYKANSFERIGAFDTADNVETNSGEIVMFHGEEVGVVKSVVEADWQSITLTGDGILDEDFLTYTGSNPIDYGLLYVVVLSGKAKGQVRRILSGEIPADDTILYVDRWQHVKPEAGDNVVVRPLYLQNAIVDNYIDPTPVPGDVTINFNRTGILLWQTAIDTLIANNTIKHCAEGIRIQCSTGGRWVSGRNVIVDNAVTDAIAGGPIDLYSKGFAEVGGGAAVAGTQWHTFGNVCRRNRFEDAEMGVLVGVSDFDTVFAPRDDALFTAGASVGVMGSIVEKNILRNISTADREQCYGVSSNWTLFRKNQVDALPGFSSHLPGKTYQVLVIE